LAAADVDPLLADEIAGAGALVDEVVAVVVLVVAGLGARLHAARRRIAHRGAVEVRRVADERAGRPARTVRTVVARSAEVGLTLAAVDIAVVILAVAPRFG